MTNSIDDLWVLATFGVLLLILRVIRRRRARRRAPEPLGNRMGGRVQAARDRARQGQDVAAIARELYLAQDAVRSALIPVDPAGPRGRFFRMRAHRSNGKKAGPDVKALWL